MTASNGGNLQIATTLNNTGGTIDPGTGTIQLSAANLTAGDILAGTVNVTTSSTLNDLTTAADIDITGGDNLAVNGTITNNGTINVNSDGVASNSILDPNNIVTFDGTGEVVLNATTELGDAQVGGATNDFQITNGTNHTFRGTGQIITRFVNNNVVSADSSGDDLLLSGAVKINNATLEARAGGNLLITTTVNNSTGGTIDPNDGTVELAGATVNNGNITAGQVNVTATSNLTDVTTAAIMDVTGGDNLNVNGTITNTGSITINSDGVASNSILDPNGNTLFTGGGQVVLNAVTDLPDATVGEAVNDFVITNDTGHTFRGTGQIITAFDNDGLTTADVNGEDLLLSGGAKTNTGEFRAENGGTLQVSVGNFANDGTFTIDTGGSIIVGGTLTNNTSGLIQGDDQVSVISSTTGMIVNNGTIAPGNPTSGGPDAGFLNLASSLDLGDDSLLDFEIGGGTSGVSFDYLSVFLSLQLDGDLSLSLFNGFTPDSSDTFTIIDVTTTTGLTGAFDNVANGGELLIDSGLGSFTVNYGSDSAFNTGDVVLSNFVAIPEPTTITLLGLGLGGLLLRRRARKH